MTPPNDRDIGMIGAGPIGLFVANLMGLAGHRVWHHYEAQRSPRADGNPQTMYVQTAIGPYGELREPMQNSPAIETGASELLGQSWPSLRNLTGIFALPRVAFRLNSLLFRRAPSCR